MEGSSGNVGPTPQLHLSELRTTNVPRVDRPDRPRVCVLGAVPAEISAALSGSFDLLDHPEGADGLLSLLTTPVDAALLDRAGPGLAVVANYAVGVDNVDLGAARARGVVVANTPDVLTDATAELAIALTLALLRRLVEGDRFVRARSAWTFSLEFMLGRSLRGARFLVVGPGRIGRATAALADALGARTSFAGRGADLHALLGQADVVSLHVPLLPETRHLIDARALAAMQPTAVLVNTARGAVVDEPALVAALRSGTIAGAALDVFEHEPLPADDPLVSLDNVILTPHWNASTADVFRATGRAMALGMIQVSRGELPDNVVNRDVLARPGFIEKLRRFSTG